MARLMPRYSKPELERLTELIYPEERRHEFTAEPWGGEGFRHYLNPKIVCLEHYLPPDKPILPSRCGGFRWFRAANVIPMEQWRRRENDDLGQERIQLPG